ncbi:MAG TPA: hypothetical protein VIO60_05675 [Rectinemataceae bacterium]
METHGDENRRDVPSEGAARLGGWKRARFPAFGILLGAALLLASLILGNSAFGSAYYSHWLMAGAGVFLILIAWLLRMKDSGFFGSVSQPSRSAQSILLTAGLFLLAAAAILYEVAGLGASI